MKTISELTDVYYTRLYPILEELEVQRKKLKTKIINIGIVYNVVALIIFFLLISVHIELGNLYAYIVFVIFSQLFLYKYLSKDYVDNFKQKIMFPLVNSLSKNLTYMPKLFIPHSYFQRSQLFVSRDYEIKVNGDDYIRGKIDDIEVQISELHVEKKLQNKTRGDKWHGCFHGLFIVSEFNKKLKGQTFVLPDSAQKIFGTQIGNFLQSTNTHTGKLVKMDNINFEKEFVVYSTDQIEARYILTPAMMERILQLKNSFKHPLHLSFIGNYIYIAIEYNKDLFEPSVFRSLLEYKIAMQYLQTLHLAIGIVEELKLNQKLWSKL